MAISTKDLPNPFPNEDYEKQRIVIVKELLIALESGQTTFLQFVDHVKSLVCQEDRNLEAEFAKFDFIGLLTDAYPKNHE